MYLKQMGQVPFADARAGGEISKRIEAARMSKGIMYGFALGAKEHIALAEKLLAEPPKERFDRSFSTKNRGPRKNISRRCAS